MRSEEENPGEEVMEDDEKANHRTEEVSSNILWSGSINGQLRTPWTQTTSVLESAWWSCSTHAQ